MLLAALDRPELFSVPCVKGDGMCVSRKHGLVIVVGLDGKQAKLQMYSVHDGTLLRSYNHEGIIRGVCISHDDDSVLVTRQCHDVVEQLRAADGSSVRIIGRGKLSMPSHVDCNAKVVLVSGDFDYIQVFSWEDGTPLWRVGSYGTGKGEMLGPGALLLLRDGTHFVMADYTGDKLCVFEVTGLPCGDIKHEDIFWPLGVLESQSGATALIVSNTGGTAAVVAQHQGALCVADFQHIPHAVALRWVSTWGALAVRDDDRIRVFPGLTLRFEWISACMIYSHFTSDSLADFDCSLHPSGLG